MVDFNDKSILVTGATGLIGSNLVAKLMEKGVAQLIVTGRSKEKLEATFADYSGDPRFKILAQDAAEPLPTDIQALDYIFHAAGPMERDFVMNRPVDVVRPNILGTMHSLDFLRNQLTRTGKKGRLVVFSSVTVYANPGQEDYVAVEADTTHAIALEQPYACYAESKRMAEVIARSYARQYNVDCVIARFSTVYGWCRNIPKTAFFEFIGHALRGEAIQLNGRCMPRRDNIYVDDAVEGLLTIALKGETGEAYNISSNGEMGHFAAVDEIAALIANVAAELTDKAVKVIKPADEAPRSPGLLLSNEKLKALGWACKTSHRDGIRKTIEKIRA